MTLQETLQLLNAGYSKEEIQAMESQTVDNSTKMTENEYVVEENSSDEVEEQNDENVQSSGIDSMRNEFNSFMSEMQKEMKEQIKVLQKFNQQHDRIVAVEKPDDEDLIARIIEPNKNK